MRICGRVDSDTKKCIGTTKNPETKKQNKKHFALTGRITNIQTTIKYVSRDRLKNNTKKQKAIKKQKHPNKQSIIKQQITQYLDPDCESYSLKLNWLSKIVVFQNM